MNKKWLSMLLLLIFLSGCGGDADRGTSINTIEPVVGEGEVRVGEPAPTFRLQTTDGRIIDLEDLKGEAVIVNFWATWCGPCRVEMPELQAAYERYGDEGLEVLGVEIRTSGDAEESAAFLEETGVSFSTFRDEQGLMEQRYLRRPAMPTTIFIDREGIVRFVQIGPVTAEFIQEQLDGFGF